MDVRDVGLGGAPDSTILAHALRQKLAIVTADLGFASLLTYPLGSHNGIVVARLPQELSVTTLNKRIAEALKGIAKEDIAGALVIIEPERIRLRQA